MKIHQLLNRPSIIITNEENDFINHYGESIYLDALDDHGRVVAKNLLRKGIYKIGNDNKRIVKND